MSSQNKKAKHTHPSSNQKTGNDIMNTIKENRELYDSAKFSDDDISDLIENIKAKMKITDARPDDDTDLLSEIDKLDEQDFHCVSNSSMWSIVDDIEEKTTATTTTDNHNHSFRIMRNDTINPSFRIMSNDTINRVCEYEYDDDDHDPSILQLAFIYKRSEAVTSKLIELSKGLIMEKMMNGDTSLCTAIRENIPIGTIMKLIQSGGRELVKLWHSGDGWYKLYEEATSMGKYDRNRIASELIDIGGNDAIKQDSKGRNVLFYACKDNAPKELISKLISIGGDDLLRSRDLNGVNALQYAFFPPRVLIIVGDRSMITSYSW